MLWAACCTCFFGFLRSDEIAVPLQKDYAVRSISHMVMSHSTQNTPPVWNIKASKTDPFQKGVTIYVGCTNNDLCPVAALAVYTTIRGTNDGPFFVLEN